MSQLVFAGFAPGLPHVLYSERSAKWAVLDRAYRQLAENLRAAKPDVLVLYSTQWISVLGTSFQTHPHPKGVHVDENWYELGDLPFDFKTDAALAEAFCAATVAGGKPAKTVCYDEFPIDTGTIVALRYLNPDGKLPVAIVSSCVYSDAEASFALGRTMRETADKLGRRAAFIGVSGLSMRFYTDEINPKDDIVSSEADEAWNQKVLGTLESGDLAKARELALAFATEALADMRFHAFHWLAGTVAGDTCRGQVLGYGPLWGTGAAVVQFTGEKA